MGGVGLPTLWYPSSVNRGYFSYLWLPIISRAYEVGIHPLSIEAISPTGFADFCRDCCSEVSILCQSRLFLLQLLKNEISAYATEYPSSVNRGYFSYQWHFGAVEGAHLGIHPLSIEAISPTVFATDRNAIRC